MDMLEMFCLTELHGADFWKVLEKILLRLPGGNAAVHIFESIGIGLPILIILIALVQIFAGYRLRRLWTMELGTAVVGVTAAIAAVYFGLPDVAVIALTAVAALVGAVLSYSFWKEALFLRVLLVVAGVIFITGEMYGQPEYGMIAGAAAGLIAGVLVSAFRKPATIIYTSIIGAVFVAISLGMMNLSVIDARTSWYIAGALMLAGLIVQFLMAREKPDRAAENEEPAETEPEPLKEAVIPETHEEPEDYAEEIAVAIEVTEPAAVELTSEDKQPETTELVRLCPDCGAEYKKAKFCIKCGRKLV